jgi:hypothetical protein
LDLAHLLECLDVLALDGGTRRDLAGDGRVQRHLHDRAAAVRQNISVPQLLLQRGQLGGGCLVGFHQGEGGIMLGFGELHRLPRDVVLLVRTHAFLHQDFDPAMRASGEVQPHLGLPQITLDLQPLDREVEAPQVKLGLHCLELSAVRAQGCGFRCRERRLDVGEHLAGLDVVADVGQLAGGRRQGTSRDGSADERRGVGASDDRTGETQSSRQRATFDLTQQRAHLPLLLHQERHRVGRVRPGRLVGGGVSRVRRRVDDHLAQIDRVLDLRAVEDQPALVGAGRPKRVLGYENPRAGGRVRRDHLDGAVRGGRFQPHRAGSHRLAGGEDAEMSQERCGFPVDQLGVLHEQEDLRCKQRDADGLQAVLGMGVIVGAGRCPFLCA